MKTQINTTGLGPAGMLIAKGWTQGNFAVDDNGDAVSRHSLDAVCFCALGAIGRAYAFDLRDNAGAALTSVIATDPDDPYIMSWNDKLGRTHNEVIEAFRKAGI